MRYDFAHAIIAVLERKENLEDVKGISLLSILDLIQMEETTCMFEVETPDVETLPVRLQLWNSSPENLRTIDLNFHLKLKFPGESRRIFRI